VRNDDDEALSLTQFVTVSDKEYLIFRIPEKFSSEKKALQLFYGAEYAQRPRYDISDALASGTEYSDFALGAGKQNPGFKLTLFDPPYSIWLFQNGFLASASAHCLADVCGLSQRKDASRDSLAGSGKRPLCG
jgi:hypothetical protein